VANKRNRQDQTRLLTRFYKHGWRKSSAASCPNQNRFQISRNNLRR
jgi:hypothetical protein